MPYLIFIRHSISQPQPKVSAHQWMLSVAGQARCTALADRLRSYAIEQIYASPEPKARLTGALLARHLGAVPMEEHIGLMETRRTTAPYFDNIEDFQAAIQRAMAAPDELLFGEETFTAARERFGEAVRQVLLLHPQQTVALVTHGTVLSLYLAPILHRPSFDLWQLWGMPAYVVLSQEDMQVVELVEEVVE